MSHAAEKFLDAWCNSYPVTLFASVLKSVVARGDGEIVPGTSHRVWEMPAEQQAGEMLLLGFVAVVVYLLMSLREGPTRGGWKDLGLESMRASSVPAQAKHTKSALDWLWILVNCVTLVIYAWHRTNDGSLVYFTQPCTVISFLTLVFIHLSDDRSQPAQARFTMIMCQLWGPAVATVFPDGGAGWQYLEYPNFLVLHLGILLAPIYFLFTCRYRYLSEDGLHWPIKSWSINLGYHVFVLKPLSLLLAVNLDVQLYPHSPAFMAFSNAVGFGKYYLTASTLATLPLSIAMPFFFRLPAALLRFVLGFCFELPTADWKSDAEVAKGKKKD